MTNAPFIALLNSKIEVRQLFYQKAERISRVPINPIFGALLASPTKIA